MSCLSIFRLFNSYLSILHSGNTIRIFKRMCSFNKNNTQVIYFLVKELHVIEIRQIINVIKKIEKGLDNHSTSVSVCKGSGYNG